MGNVLRETSDDDLDKPLRSGAAARRMLCTPTTVWRWTVKGRKLPDGTTLFLEAFRIGSRLWTTERAIRAFIAASTAAYLDRPAVPTPRSPTEAARAHERDDAELAKIVGA